MSYSILWPTVEQRWPRRLLHVPTMTSIEHRDGAFYANDKEPQYSIVSYTWGRFEIPYGPRIHIEGISWPIPAISEDHFTVAGLRQLLNQVSSKSDYVWIDVACIDQKDDSSKMDEVGRQASIFKGSFQAYIWLNKHEPRILRELIQTVLRCAYEIAKDQGNSFQATKDLNNSLSTLFEDPWFSSLWTLQESMLQKHALILDRNAQPIITHGPWTGDDPSTQLFDISGACAIARTIANHQVALTCEGNEGGHVSPKLEILRELSKLVEESGVAFTLCPNPNILYAASKYRKTSREVDRIYAIMQVYGFVLGQAAEPHREFDLETLELQFLRTLNTQSPVLGQAFQSLGTPTPGESWCLTSNVFIPDRLHMIIHHKTLLSSSCKINVHSKRKAYFEGHALSLREVLAFWKVRNDDAITALEGKPDLEIPKHGMFLDYSQHYDFADLSNEWPPDTSKTNDNGSMIVETRRDKLEQASEREQAAGRTLISQYGEDTISVLYLGRTKYVEKMDIALLIVKEKSIWRTNLPWQRTLWKRIGICFFPSTELETCVENGAGFALLKGIFG